MKAYIFIFLIILSSCSSINTSPEINPDTAKSIRSVERQYLVSIFDHLQPFWKLPDDEQWDPSLVSIVVIKINRSGEIEKKYFEQSSGNRKFDSYVLQALKKASPLPSIPAEMEKDEMEIGLQFIVNPIE